MLAAAGSPELPLGLGTIGLYSVVPRLLTRGYVMAGALGGGGRPPPADAYMTWLGQAMLHCSRMSVWQASVYGSRCA